LRTLPDYLVAGAVVVVVVLEAAVVVVFLGVVVVVFLELAATVFVAGFGAGFVAVVVVEDACALAPRVIRAAAKTRARLFKLFIVCVF
jgi:hypothetical protein